MSRWSNRTDAALRLRAQLGLPTDRPIIMAGHQVEPWHPGILAKFIAAHAFARSIDATTAWLFVDHDTGDTRSLATPSRTPDDRLKRAVISLADASSDDVPLSHQRAFRPIVPNLDAVEPASAREGILAWSQALVRHSNKHDAASQAAGALSDLAAPWCTPDATLFASHIAETDAFAALIDAMRHDPRGCAESYNAAAADSPDARIALLHTSTNNADVELPLWIMPESFGRPRRKAMRRDLDSIPLSRLMPRALTMTALVRSGACDLFIHGRGGARYDIITERWMRNWRSIDLAPATVVSVDLHLPLAECPVHESDVNLAFQRWHTARHDPATLDAQDDAAHKRQLVDAIAEKKSRGEKPTIEFQQMHSLLRNYRSRHANQIASLAEQAHDTRQRYEQTHIITARDWPFFLYTREALDDLAKRILAEISLRQPD